MTRLIILLPMVIMAVPVVALVIASIFGAPRMSKVQGLFLGSLILLTAASILIFALFSAILGFIVSG